MELTTAVEPKSTRRSVCSSCGTDLTPKLDISIPGLNRLFDKSVGKPIKFTWIVIVLICAIVCAGFTIYQLMEFFRSPIASKTFVERKQKVQFPSFSICAIDQLCFTEVIENAVKNKCTLNDTQECDADNTSFKELNISLLELWDQCNFLEISVNIDSSSVFAEPDTKDHVITHKNSFFGACAVVTHIEEILYLSVMTQLRVTIHTRNKHGVLTFIPHGEPEFNVNEFEVFNHEMEFIHIGFNTQLKIKEEVFRLQNGSDRLCYDLNSERERMTTQALHELKNLTCRLPFLSDNIRQCETLGEVKIAIFESIIIIAELLNGEDWLIRRPCNETVYAISVDYIIPNEFMVDGHRETSNDTVLIIKFADDTSEIISEYFSYTFPALVSDLFAYWGFFLCLSALVFVEIIEFLIQNMYLWFKRAKNRSSKRSTN